MLFSGHQCLWYGKTNDCDVYLVPPTLLIAASCAFIPNCNEIFSVHAFRGMLRVPVSNSFCKKFYQLSPSPQAGLFVLILALSISCS